MNSCAKSEMGRAVIKNFHVKKTSWQLQPIVKSEVFADKTWECCVSALSVQDQSWLMKQLWIFTVCLHFTTAQTFHCSIFHSTTLTVARVDANWAALFRLPLTQHRYPDSSLRYTIVQLTFRVYFIIWTCGSDLEPVAANSARYTLQAIVFNGSVKCNVCCKSCLCDILHVLTMSCCSQHSWTLSSN